MYGFIYSLKVQQRSYIHNVTDSCDIEDENIDTSGTYLMYIVCTSHS